MKNWICCKDKEPVNLDHSDMIRVVDVERRYGIRFESNYGDYSYVQWEFDTKEERDAVFEAIKKQMTEIELEYHPDHDFENE